ncbi:DNA-binding response regulator, OmpR family, contains REC and winged-helix (wHTH) domain [Agrococcus baldri]|uniref:DNA-binding response regulator, OmpR family, contains REC and winged-helix (WHTH) domain n=1 Tax=Agrococcus baldri TaxID=153730 RepID=A0AA94HPV3_9MICO|nr:response regulator transcription factor [Agrococcus baldri]SFS18485.1 DNA-binding response regulator, OmpR family, contains REC and winged-helix (wHTH) domain [Agrococcus baldri]
MDEDVAVVIEDGEDIRELLAQVLTQGGFAVHSAADGATGVELVREHDPIVVTIDVNMPGIDGFETARQVRAISTAYIVMITARGDEIDTLVGLQTGADDYIVKPFRPRELRARIEAMMRRPRVLASTHPSPPHPSAPQPSAPQPMHTGSIPTQSASSLEIPDAPSATWAEGDTEHASLEHRGLRLEPGARVVELEGAEVELTRSEFDILRMLLNSGRRVVSKMQLAGMLRGERGEPDHYLSEHDARAIEVHVANLRRKLGESPSEPRWIETVRGVGYRRTA